MKQEQLTLERPLSNLIRGFQYYTPSSDLNVVVRIKLRKSPNFSSLENRTLTVLIKFTSD